MTIGIATRGYYGTIDLIGGPPRAGASATSSTTTLTAIRRQMVATIKAITPSSLSGEPFRVTQTEMSSFGDYAEQNAQACFREYEIEFISDEAVGMQNYQLEMRVARGELGIAYPHTWGWYRTKDQTNVWNERALRALANEDRNLIDKAIGIRGGSNYVAAQRSCAVGAVTFDEGENVTMMILPLEVTYLHSSS